MTATLKILITRPFTATTELGSRLPANRVSLMRAGAELAVESRTVFQKREYDRAALNRMGRPGAIVSTPNERELEIAIREMVGRHPEFAGAEIHNNSGVAVAING